MTYKAVVKFEYEDSAHAKIVADSVSLEKPKKERSEIDLKPDGNFLIMTASASDISAFRAILNSYLRLVKIASDAAEA